MFDLTQFISDPTKVGMLGLMAVAITAILRGWVITAAHHQAVVTELKSQLADALKEKSEYKELALRGVELTNRALTAAEKVAGK